MGRFEDCTNLTDFNYILATIPDVFPIPMSLGLCVPSVCSAADFDAFKPFFVEVINAIIPEFFAGIKGFNPDT